VPILELCCEKNLAINIKEQKWQVRHTKASKKMRANKKINIFNLVKSFSTYSIKSSMVAL
jgi:hypothetical protein